MQSRFRYLLLLILSLLSLSNAIADKLCIDNLEAISKIAGNQLGPPMQALVCSKGIKVGKADWPWFEPHIQGLMNRVKECSEKPDLPNWKPKVQKLGDTIVKRCLKDSHNYCNVNDLKEVKACAIAEAIGWGMGNMDMLKYVDKKNCAKLVPCLKNPRTWAVAKKLVKEFAEHKSH